MTGHCTHELTVWLLHKTYIDQTSQHPNTGRARAQELLPLTKEPPQLTEELLPLTEEFLAVNGFRTRENLVENLRLLLGLLYCVTFWFVFSSWLHIWYLYFSSPVDGPIPVFIWAAQMGINRLFKKQSIKRKHEVERGWGGSGRSWDKNRGWIWSKYIACVYEILKKRYNSIFKILIKYTVVLDKTEQFKDVSVDTSWLSEDLNVKSWLLPCSFKIKSMCQITADKE